MKMKPKHARALALTLAVAMVITPIVATLAEYLRAIN